MANLRATFDKSVSTIFKVFESFQEKATYHVLSEHSGWGDSPEPEDFPMDCILESMSQGNIRNYSFYPQIAPDDVIILIQGLQIRDFLEVKNSDRVTIHFSKGDKTYIIISHDTDPAQAHYAILLRENI